MAVIDIDRHILTELNDLVVKKTRIRKKINVLYDNYKELEGREQALLNHLVGEVKKAESNRDSE